MNGGRCKVFIETSRTRLRVLEHRHRFSDDICCTVLDSVYTRSTVTQQSTIDPDTVPLTTLRHSLAMVCTRYKVTCMLNISRKVL
jgi:hypothetical protein